MRKLLVWLGLAIAVPACVGYWLWDRDRVFSDEALCIERNVLTAKTATSAKQLWSMCRSATTYASTGEYRPRYRCYFAWIPKMDNVPAAQAAERMCDLRTR